MNYIPLTEIRDGIKDCPIDRLVVALCTLKMALTTNEAGIQKIISLLEQEIDRQNNIENTEQS